MEKVLEFEFEDGSRMRLERIDGGELQISLQARHPGEGWKITSTTVIIDQEKVKTFKAWFEQQEGTK